MATLSSCDMAHDGVTWCQALLTTFNTCGCACSMVMRSISNVKTKAESMTSSTDVAF